MHSPKHTLGQKYNITNDERINLYEVIENVMKRLDKEVRYKNFLQNCFYTSSYIRRNLKTILFGKEPILTKYTVSVLSKARR